MPLSVIAKKKEPQGYSLVELLVAAVIMALLITAAVVTLRRGREFDITENHRRRARMAIDSSLESTTYHYSNYALLATGSTTVPNITIDSRDPATTDDDLQGTLTIVVSSATIASLDGTPVAIKQVTMTLAWQEPGGAGESITLTKNLSGLL